jgi:hypothetical protein
MPQIQSKSSQDIDMLVNRCADVLIPRALSLGAFAGLDKQLGPALGMPNSGIPNRQALRMWIRWRLEEGCISTQYSRAGLRGLMDTLWSGLQPMLLQVLPVANTQQESNP